MMHGDIRYYTCTRLPFGPFQVQAVHLLRPILLHRAQHIPALALVATFPNPGPAHPTSITVFKHMSVASSAAPVWFSVCLVLAVKFAVLYTIVLGRGSISSNVTVNSEIDRVGGLASTMVVRRRVSIKCTIFPELGV